MKLVFDNVSKSYGKTKALTEFSAELDPGIYALLGPNGSGKSTLMNILTDNLKADGGKIYYDGEDVLKMGVRFREKLGFMPQYPGMYGNFTAKGFLLYMAALKGMKKNEAEKSIPEILDAVELSDVANYRISSFSGGMKQRLALAQAVLGDPSVLVLDEPTAGLDPQQRIAVKNYISRIALNKIVIVATHIVSDIEYIAQKAIILKKGKMIDCAYPCNLTDKMKGKVWETVVEESEIAGYQQDYTVSGVFKDGGKVRLRIISEGTPNPGAKTVYPGLEDFYLYIFGQRSCGSE